MLKKMITGILESGLTQTQISQRTGIPQPTFSRILNGTQKEINYSDGKLIEDLFNEVAKAKAA